MRDEARGIEKDIDSADLSGELIDGHRVAYVEPAGHGDAVAFQRIEGGGVDVSGDDAGALAGESDGRGAADAGPRGCAKGGLAV